MNMADAVAKLREDLEVLEAMAAEMNEYLMSEVLFWPMRKGNLPRLTIGGYLMREHRLRALADLLSEEERQRLAAAVEQFNQALVEKVVRFERRANEELPARLRQWGEYLRDLKGEARASAGYYPSAVETRAIIDALVDKLERPPYQLEQNALQPLAMLDQNLRAHWQPGDFVWPDGWQPAYPQTRYWWLHGLPR
jgi:hypothetical protein